MKGTRGADTVEEARSVLIMEFNGHEDDDEAGNIWRRHIAKQQCLINVRTLLLVIPFV